MLFRSYGQGRSPSLIYPFWASGEHSSVRLTVTTIPCFFTSVSSFFCNKSTVPFPPLPLLYETLNTPFLLQSAPTQRTDTYGFLCMNADPNVQRPYHLDVMKTAPFHFRLIHDLTLDGMSSVPCPCSTVIGPLPRGILNRV